MSLFTSAFRNAQAAQSAIRESARVAAKVAAENAYQACIERHGNICKALTALAGESTGKSAWRDQRITKLCAQPSSFYNELLDELMWAGAKPRDEVRKLLERVFCKAGVLDQFVADPAKYLG